jgi:disulfide bond formation protein DsbB
MRRGFINALLALAVLALAVVPIGTAVFVLGFGYGDSPCVMCWEQRIGMALVALIGLFVLRYGPKPRYVGLAVLVGAWGIHMGMRHVGMHAARDVGQGFSVMILGAHTYTWALFIFWVTVVTLALLLMMSRDGDVPRSPRPLGPLGSLTMGVFLAVVAGNIVQAFCSTGPPPYMGQGDPVRFSFNPAHWVWSTEEYSPAPITWRGRWAIEAPDVASVPADPGGSPFADLPLLAVKQQKALALPLRGTITDLAHDPASDRFLVTTQEGVYLLDAALDRVLRYTVVDPGYSVDLGRFAGGAFLDKETVIAVGENKSYVVLRENDKADAAKNFRYFLDSFDKFDEVSRGRFGTVRARMMYTMSLAFDAAANSLYTVTVPNAKVKRLVLSRFDRKDLTLSEEYSPAVGPGLTLKKGRTVDQLYITGATIASGKMYAISAAGSTLLTIDLATHTIVAAHTIRGLAKPTGLAVKGDDLYIATAGGTVLVISRT